MPFDSLIQKVDQLVESGTITEPVICQIGKGTYEPKHCEHFHFRPSLEQLFAQADLIITHGGMTVIGLLVSRKRFVAVANYLAADKHQQHFLERLAKQTTVHWTADVQQLETLIAAARTAVLDFDQMPSLADDLKEYLRSNKAMRPKL
jgi:UDP-N-acetylglucosamine transferase subunit ALG13